MTTILVPFDNVNFSDAKWKYERRALRSNQLFPDARRKLFEEPALPRALIASARLRQRVSGMTDESSRVTFLSETFACRRKWDNGKLLVARRKPSNFLAMSRTTRCVAAKYNTSASSRKLPQNDEFGSAFCKISMSPLRFPAWRRERLTESSRYALGEERKNCFVRTT